MPDYQALESKHLQEPPSQPAHDEEAEIMNQVFECPHCGGVTVVPEGEWFDAWCEICSNDMFALPEQAEEEMTPTNEKAAAEGATSTTAHEQLANSSIPTLYMLKRGANTRDFFGTWSGALLPKGDYMEVAVNVSDLRSAYKNGKGEFTLNQECVIAHDGEISRLQAEKEEQRRREEERSAQFDEELSLIKSITGMDLSRDDLPLIMLEYRRAGKDFQRFLDALEAIDDLDLQRVGLTAWEWDNDER